MRRILGLVVFCIAATVTVAAASRFVEVTPKVLSTEVSKGDPKPVGTVANSDFVLKIDPTNTVKATPTPKAYVAPTPAPDPDPIISCAINDKCGGGTKDMKRSECFASTCCGITNDNWVLTKDLATCKDEQKSYQDKMNAEAAQRTADTAEKQRQATQASIDEVNRINAQYQADSQRQDEEQRQESLKQQAEFNTRMLASCITNEDNRYRSAMASLQGKYASLGSLESSGYAQDEESLNYWHGVYVTNCNTQYGSK